tara:strand:+ start:381 stop:1040 length:660 start_codon:yes stop_codon:yes gene_type:complete
MRQVLQAFFLFAAIAPNISLSEISSVENYDEISQNIFWSDLYPGGGWSLYCGFRFENALGLNEEHLFVIEHIYRISEMLKFLKCESRRQCRLEKNEKFIRMEADMQNLYPVWQDASVARRDAEYGSIEGEIWRFENCDYERDLKIIEPRPLARGNIARSIFYMNSQYGLPIDKSHFDLLKKWNMEDLPSKQEKSRNDRIEEIQGNRNPYIDNPDLINSM